MWVILHRVTHDIGHFDKPAVVERLHRVHDATLHRLEAVVDMRHRTFQNHIRRVVEKPAAIHPTQTQFCCLRSDCRGKIHSLLLHLFGHFIGFLYL